MLLTPNPVMTITRIGVPQRQHMVRADLVRVKSGDIVDPSTLRRSAQRKLGHSYALVYVEPDSVEVGAHAC